MMLLISWPSGIWSSRSGRIGESSTWLSVISTTWISSISSSIAREGASALELDALHDGPRGLGGSMAQCRSTGAGAFYPL